MDRAGTDLAGRGRRQRTTDRRGHRDLSVRARLIRHQAARGHAMTVAIVLSSGLPVLVLVLALALPSITSPTVPFGVRVPAQRADDPTVVRQIRIYRWRVLGSGIVAAGVSVVIYSVT